MERSTGVFDCLMNLMQKERESGDLPPCNKDEGYLMLDKVGRTDDRRPSESNLNRISPASWRCRRHKLS